MIIRLHNRASGFSLVELLLTLVLILCLAAAAVFSFTSIYRGSNLDEGMDRMQALLRFAQAEAATTGRKVRLEFESSALDHEAGVPDLRRIRVTWEPDYLNAPGIFQTYTNKTWSEEMVNELVGVETVKSLEPDRVMRTPSAPASELETDPESPLTSEEFPAITFYPDGSCDSTEIVLASLNSEDVRRCAVRIRGIIGSVSSHVVSATEDESLVSDEFSEQAASEEFNALFETASPALTSLP